MQRLAFALALAMSTAAGSTAGEADKTSPAPEDRFLWLEDVTGDKSLDWARARNAESATVLATPEEAALEKRILDILDSKERIPEVDKHGRYYYNFWRDAKNPRGLWRRTTLEEYRKAEPAVGDGARPRRARRRPRRRTGSGTARTCLKPDYKRCLVSLSRGGADADVVREFDLEDEGASSRTASSCPRPRATVAWRDRDSALRRHRLRPRLADDVGLSADRQGVEARHAARRRPRRSSRASPRTCAACALHDDTKGFERDFVSRGITFYTNELFLRRDGKLVKIEKPDDANANVHRDLLLLELRDDWTVGGKTYPAGALLATDFEAFLEGERTLRRAVRADRAHVAGRPISPTLHTILLNELDNVKNRVYVLTRKDGKWTREELPGMPEFGTVAATAVDPDESDDYFLTVTDYLTPTEPRARHASARAPPRSSSSARVLRRRGPRR